jgi:chromosome segregation ATPase
MAKTTSFVEVQIAKKKSLEKGQENVAAALDQLDSASQGIAKSTAIVKRRLEELDELANDFEARLRDAEASHEKEVQQLREQYTRDTTALQTRLAAAEEKLRKVQATLA